MELAAKRPTHYYPIMSSRTASYYYVDAATQNQSPYFGVYDPAGPEPTPALLNEDIAQHHVKLPKAAHLVKVNPGTVLVQATSAPEVPVPNSFYVLKDEAYLTGSNISNPQATTDPQNGVVVSFGFKGNGASIFQNVTKTLAQRGLNNTVAGLHDDQLAALRGHARPADRDRAPDRRQPVPQRHPLGQRLGDQRQLHVRDRHAARERARERRAAA